ncbi:MAG: DUF1549 domain-containing protein [Verrucomicrobia bacterium]|nr:DUF1549 domain-containing protein [Verrucomicrobiota bacterium]
MFPVRCALLAATFGWWTVLPASDSLHWAFQPPVRGMPPRVRQAGWVRNPVDAFILHRLEEDSLSPSATANPATLIRRVALDLTGLPPTVEDLEAFLQDPRPDAYERAVDRMLASPHFGERWGRHWLDAARYADSNGYSIDAPRSLWPWRDWVVAALNRDQPYAEFLTDQLAGDLLENATREQQVATGFHRNTQINEEGGIDPEQFRIESVLDRVNTTGTVFLGLTVACAQCHDHKFDPLSQREYFQLYAFFNNQDEPSLEAASPEQFAARDAVGAMTRPLEGRLQARAAELAPGFESWESTLTPATRESLPLEVRNVLGLRPEHRTARQRETALQGYYATDDGYRRLRDQLRDARQSAPVIPTTLVLQERAEPRSSVVFIKGDFTRPGDPVQPGTPAVLPPLTADGDFAPNRLDLARWIADPEHPLTARVLVNRVWQQLFGRGLVETENDFGIQGAPPSHPELLDWLATEFSGTGSAATPTPGSLKRLIRLLVTSATYRQSSDVPDAATAPDPLNRLLGRQSRLRLEGEVIRDVALAASGQLDRRLGGPPVFPPQPDGVMAMGQSRREWKTSEGGDRFRRGLYTFRWRATPHPALTVFDGPDAFSACTRRLKSNTPLQSLTLLNDAAFLELAEGLAERVLREAPEATRLNAAFLWTLGRPPESAETARLQQLLDAERQAGDERMAWITVARVLLNLDETITRE